MLICDFVVMHHAEADTSAILRIKAAPHAKSTSSEQPSAQPSRQLSGSALKQPHSVDAPHGNCGTIDPPPVFLVAIDGPGHHLAPRKRDRKVVQPACPVLLIKYLCKDGPAGFVVTRLARRVCQARQRRAQSTACHGARGGKEMAALRQSRRRNLLLNSRNLLHCD